MSEEQRGIHSADWVCIVIVVGIVAYEICKLFVGAK